MPLDEVEALRQSAIISRIVSVFSDCKGDGESRLKVRVELVNGWQMDYWERVSPQSRRYSFHVFQGDRVIVRWDNAPHHRYVGTFPHHKHVGAAVAESEEMDIAKALIELAGMMQ